MQDQQCLPQRSEIGSKVVPLDVFEKLAPDGKGAPSDIHLRLAAGLQFVARRVEQMAHVRRVGRRADGGHGADAVNLHRGAKRSGSAQGVTDQKLRSRVGLPQTVGGSGQVRQQAHPVE